MNGSRKPGPGPIVLYSGLTPEEHELLDMIQEECAEVIQAIAKVKRHGWTDTSPEGKVYDNRADVETELGDVQGLVTMAHRAGLVSITRIADAAGRKPAKCIPFMHHWRG